MLTTALDVIITLKFCFTFSRVMHVLSLCVCYNKELTLNLFWFIRETSLSSSLCQQEQPVNEPVFARLQQRIRHIGEEMLPRGFSDTLKWTQTKILACDVSLFFFFFVLSVWLPLCLSHSVHSFERNTVAKLESSCQSKQYFLFIILFTL